MSVNEEFKNKLSEWIEIDDKIDELNSRLKDLREVRNQRLDELILFAKKNNLDKYTLDIGNNQKIKFSNTTSSKPISFKFLKECLEEFFFKLDFVEDYTSSIIEFIKDRQEKNEKMTIKRFK